jgi:hypothetical protein
LGLRTFEIKNRKPPLQSKFTLLPSKFFPAKISFSKKNEKFGGKKIALQKSEFYFAKEQGPSKIRMLLT